MEGFIHYTLINDKIDKKKSKIDINTLIETVGSNTKKKDSLFSPYDVGYSIIKELQKIEEKDNIFFEKNIIIEDIYNIKISNFSEKHPELTLHLILDRDYYPLVPPEILILPSIDPIYMYELIQTPDLDIRNMNKIRNIDFVVKYVSNKINEYNIDCKLDSVITNEMIKLLKNNNFKMKDAIKQNENKLIKSLHIGIGYGGTSSNWDVNMYLNNQTRIKDNNQIILSAIAKFIAKNEENKDILDIHNRFKLYQFWIDLLEKYEVTEEKYFESIYHILIIINFLNLKIKIPFLDMFVSLYSSDKNPDTHKKYILLLIETVKIKEEIIEVKENYSNALKEYQFDNYPYCDKEKHAFVLEVKSFTSFVQPKTSNYIMKQIQQLSSSLPLTDGSGIFFRQDTNNLSLFKFLIIPNEDTPYKYGCFVFDVFLPANFPNEPPRVVHVTSKKNNFRINPNLYSDGKVCLSLLGTWSGQSQSEKWIAPSANSSGSTFLQLMLSIYSMIFTEYPWYNEPGRENGINNRSINKQSIDYNNEIREGTIKYAIMNQLKYPEDGFESVIKTHFKLKKNEILEYLKVQNKNTYEKAFIEYVEKTD